MSHNVLNIQANSSNVNGAITGTLEQVAELGQELTNANGQTGAGTGFYAVNDNYLFLTGADSYSGKGVSVASDTISITGGIYLITCIPTFGANSSSFGDTEIRLQFQDQAGEGLGNIGVCNRYSSGATYPGANTIFAYVEGPRDVVLKVISVSSATHFPKNGTETSASRMFLEIIRIK
tara:strand:+ start:567 stop:1100 length:534 start_codon:yes stop_codon:yes gene_type:complete